MLSSIMTTIQTILILVSGLMFIICSAGFIYVKIKMRPNDDIDEYHFEFEDHHPGLQKYNKYYNLFISGIVISMLLLFISLIF